MKTFTAKSKNIKRDWYIVNSDGKTLGRFATKLVRILSGKHKAEYTPHVDTGDYIIVLNAKKISVTGNKYKNKTYYRHTGYPGGIKKATFKEVIIRNPKRIIEIAVKGMLPKGPIGRAMYRKLKVYEDDKHKHFAQQPKFIDI
ncbi:50S ribosomal protein L13 [Candidatus Providencia siddallii]|uniref:Large ribosomal subunit protein uL13 n=1 Tax=Candidatus Providencia siddallii TaxID=1715285 RepID=A0A0M6W874_9GAMM|nr:50S ribosomal protein L13 [Candidatus Providencia siddallii]